MKKRLFEVLDDMNQSDTENKTKLVAVSNAFVSGNKVKAGAHITMGAEESCLLDLLSGKAIALLLVVDKEEYLKRQKE